MKRLKRTYILCCGKRQAAHQCPPNSGDYRIHCEFCLTEIWATRENTRPAKVCDCDRCDEDPLAYVEGWIDR